MSLVTANHNKVAAWLRGASHFDFKILAYWRGRFNAYTSQFDKQVTFCGSVAAGTIVVDDSQSSDNLCTICPDIINSQQICRHANKHTGATSWKRDHSGEITRLSLTNNYGMNKQASSQNITTLRTIKEIYRNEFAMLYWISRQRVKSFYTKLIGNLLTNWGDTKKSYRRSYIS